MTNSTGNDHTLDIHDVIDELDKGRLKGELDEALQTVAKACRDTGNKGHVQLRLKMDPKGGEITVAPEVKTKTPRRDAIAQVLWTTEDGHLSRKDPNQTEMQFRQASSEERPLRRIQNEG